MAFLTPLFLALSLLAAPIIILYMLKLRRREVEISSVMLWQMLLRDREANAPWQKLKRNLLLLLQLLLLAALVLSLARPFLKVPTVASGTVVVLLDASASMNATDVEPNRFEVARAYARQLIDGLSANGKLSLILVGHQPEVLSPASSDKLDLKAALGKAQVSEGPSDWEAALALASGTVRASSLSNSTVVIISDGGLPTDGLPALPGTVRYVPVGASADNLALAALSLRATDTGPQLFAEVANHGDADRTVIVSFSVGGQLFSAQQLTVPAGKAESIVLADLPAGPAVYQAKLSLPASAADPVALDSFALDDTAWAVYQPPSAGRVLLISPKNIFLEQVLAALPGLEPFRLTPGAPLPNDPFNLYVFDSVITDTLPAGDLLLVNPPSNPLFTVGGTFTNTALAQLATNDPLAQNLDWGNVHILKARQVTPPTWARVLVMGEGGPLVFAGETGGRRVAVLTFDLHDSDLPLQIAYPILMANLINYLAPSQAFSAPDGLRPGGTLTLKPSGGDTVIAIEDPHGARYAAQTTEAGVIFADTHTLGVYTAFSNQAILGSFAVNLFNPGESNIRPAQFITVGRSDVTASARDETGQLEIWPWVAAVAFIILLIEWWIYHRGPTLPALPGWRGLFVRRKTLP